MKAHIRYIKHNYNDNTYFVSGHPRLNTYIHGLSDVRFSSSNDAYMAICETAFKNGVEKAYINDKEVRISRRADGAMETIEPSEAEEALKVVIGIAVLIVLAILIF